MNKQERYNKIVKRLPILRDIKEEFWDIVYEPQEGDMPNHFDNLPKAERVAIIGLLNDINHLVNSVTMYESWFNNEKQNIWQTGNIILESAIIVASVKPIIDLTMKQSHFLRNLNIGENDIDTIANKIQEIYLDSYSDGYRDCEYNYANYGGLL